MAHIGQELALELISFPHFIEGSLCDHQRPGVLYGDGQVLSDRFGELAVFGDYRRESFASAQIASVIWKLPADLFREWVRTRPRLVIEVTRQIGAQIGLLREQGVIVGRVERHPVVIWRLRQIARPGDGVIFQSAGQGVGHFQRTQAASEPTTRRLSFSPSLLITVWAL